MAICKNGHRISLMVEEHPRIVFQAYSKISQSGSKGVCISRLHPDYLAHKFGLSSAKCYWLSGCKGKNVLSPRMLGQIARVIRGSILKDKDRIFFLDGLEYLILHNDMAKIMVFLEEMDATLSELGADLIISIDPLTFEPKDLQKLWAAYPRCASDEIIMTLTIQQPQRCGVAVPESGVQTI